MTKFNGLSMNIFGGAAVYLETCSVYLLNLLDLLLPKMQQTRAGRKGRLDHLLLLGKGALLGRDAAQTRENSGNRAWEAGLKMIWAQLD